MVSDADFADAHFKRGNVLRAMGRNEDAVAAYTAALRLNPTLFDALFARAVLHRQRGDHEQAAADALAVLAIAGDHRGASSLAVVSLIALQRFDEALSLARSAVTLLPEDGDVRLDLAHALADVGQPIESLAELEAAERLGADRNSSNMVRGQALAMLGRDAEAEVAFGDAIASAPDDISLRQVRAYFWLAKGDLTRGFAEFESRGQNQEFASLAPQWRGEDLSGKRILVYAEQGMGDVFQFVRYIPLLKQRGAMVSLAVGSALHRLLDDNFARVMFSATGKFDFQSPLMSLPVGFGTTLETIPRDVPYLVADRNRVERWRQRLAGDGFRVGIVWQGNRQYPRDRYRSIPLRSFAPLAVPGVRLISLQVGPGVEQLASLPAGMKVEELGGPPLLDNPDGLRETAAAMMNCDLLVMSDTGPAHLAGALGRPVWLALNRYPDWRWLRDREDSPWYPTMRLFRQKNFDDWDEVFASIAEELRRRFT